MKEKVSIILPTYKRDVYYLNRALQSLLDQTYSNIEIVVIDDNHPNSDYRKHTEAFMKTFESFDKVKYYLNKENMGGAVARNEGIYYSTGEYITFLDDDDEYLPQKIDYQLKKMKEQNFEMTFTNLKLLNSDNVLVDYRDHSYLKSFEKNYLLKTHIMRKLTGTPTFMYKRDKLIEIGGFDDVPIGQEFHLMLKTIEGNIKIGFIDTCDVIAYRHNDGGISFGKKKISGERKQYTFIRDRYFKYLTPRERMFIRFRYQIVIAMAYKRNHQYIHAAWFCAVAFVYSPIDSIIESIKFFGKISQKRRKSTREDHQNGKT